ncbi:hypothetical protein [Nitratifractor sp.]
MPPMIDTDGVRADARFGYMSREQRKTNEGKKQKATSTALRASRRKSQEASPSATRHSSLEALRSNAQKFLISIFSFLIQNAPFRRPAIQNPKSIINPRRIAAPRNSSLLTPRSSLIKDLPTPYEVSK